MDIFLETERLVLRRFSEKDIDNLFLLDSDTEASGNVNGAKPGDRIAIVNEILVKLLEYYSICDNYGFWAVIRKHDDTFIGWFHFNPLPDNPNEIDLSYRFIRSTWGNGFATEGAIALINKGFDESGVKKVSARAHPENSASIRVMTKSGMSFEKKVWDPDGNELVQYSIRKESFISSE